MANNVALNQITKPKTRKGKKILESRGPQLVEPTKAAIFVKGATANDTVMKLMRDLSSIKKPDGVVLSKKNEWRPFEDQTHIEFLTQKNQAPLFMFASHSKKRPNNLIMGRTFDGHVMDMFETGVENYKPMSAFKTPKVSTGNKPIILFSGQQFETQFEYERFKNLMLDFFSGPKVESIRLTGLENVITMIASEGKIFFRHYRVLLKKSGTRLPRVELEEIGPHFDMTIRRHNCASDDLFKRALKAPAPNKLNKVKNISKSPLGTQFGRVHMERQDYTKMSTRKMKGLRKDNPNLQPLGKPSEKPLSMGSKRSKQHADREEATSRYLNKRIKFDN